MLFFKLITILIIMFGTVLQSQTFENYDMDNSGLPSNEVTSISIVDNIIWFGTSEGLASFDGENWNTENINLSSNKISSSSMILGSISDELIIGTDSGTTSFGVEGLNVIPPLSYLNVENDGIVSNNILSLTTWHDENQWIGTDNGISLVTLDSIVNLQISTPGIKLYNQFINSMAVSVDTVTHRLDDSYVPSSGVVYAATNGGGVSRFYLHEVDGISSASVVEDTWSGLPSDTVLAVFIDDNNYHWYGTPDGAAVHLEHDSKYANWSIYTTEDGLIHNRVTTVTADNFGNIWFGTIAGVSRFNGENWISFTESEGLISNNVRDIKVDSEDVVWIATDKGVSKLVSITSVDDTDINLPITYDLKLDAYPNPFNPQVNLKLELSLSSQISIDIYNINGELVKKIVNDYLSSGIKQYHWTGRDDQNQQVVSGVYIVSVTSQYSFMSKKIVLLK